MTIKYLPLIVGLLLGTFNFLEKIAISRYGISYQEAAAVKFTTAAIFVWIINYSTEESLLFSGDKYGYICLILSGILNALAIFTLYYSFRFLDVSFVAPVYNTTAIIFISILGAVFLKEHLNPVRVIGVLCCVLGIFLIVHKGE